MVSMVTKLLSLNTITRSVHFIDIKHLEWTMLSKWKCIDIYHVFDVFSAPNTQKMHLSFFFIAPIPTFSLITSFSESMCIMGHFSKDTISFCVYNCGIFTVAPFWTIVWLFSFSTCPEISYYTCLTSRPRQLDQSLRPKKYPRFRPLELPSKIGPDLRFILSIFW